MTDELKPLLSCPFCGGKSKLIESHRFGPEDTTPHYWKVSCNIIGCNGAAVNIWYPSPEAAIAAWNRRYTCKDLQTPAKLADRELPGWFVNHLKFNIAQNRDLLKTCKTLDTVLDRTRKDAIENEIRWMSHFLSLRREDAE